MFGGVGERLAFTVSPKLPLSSVSFHAATLLLMDAREPTRQRGIAARDAALRRLRWLTLAAGVLAAAVMGVLAAVTAASTHARVVVRHALGAAR